MMERDERRVLYISILTIFILTSLYLYSYTLTPKRIEISQISEHIGEYVEIEGIVKYSRNTSKGTMVELYDMNRKSETYLFLLFHKSLLGGYIIRARGIVQVYQGMIEVMVRSEKDIEVLERSLYIALEEILLNPSFFVDMKLRVYGNLTHVYPVIDEHQIEVTDGINITWVHIPFTYFGEREVYIYGMVKNGTLYGENITLFAEVKCVSIGELEKYEGKHVWICGSIISYSRLYGYSGWLKDGEYSLKVFMKEKREEGRTILEGTFVYNEKSGIYELVVE